MMSQNCFCPGNSAAGAYARCYREILNDMIRGMCKAGLTGSISHNFIVQMIPHHEAAIRMSRNLLHYFEQCPLAENEEMPAAELRRALARIAQNIIQSQTQSIASMREILPVCSSMQNTPGELRRQGQQIWQITGTMFRRMRSVPFTCVVACDFMREMIPHHEGAIEMSMSTLRFPVCSGLIPVLQDIITSQERGVAEMQQLLRKYC